MARYIDVIKNKFRISGDGYGVVPNVGEVSFEKNVTYYRVLLRSLNKLNVGDEYYFISEVNLDDALDTDGNKIDKNFRFVISNIWSNNTSNHKTNYISQNSLDSFDIKPLLDGTSKFLKISNVIILSGSILGSLQFNDAELLDSIPNAITIGNKFIKSLSIGGKSFDNLTVDGHKYTFVKDISISNQDIAQFAQAHTTWNGNIATIDTTALFKGLKIEYSKSSNIADSSQIVATVKFDSTLYNSINNTPSDFVVSGIYIVNPNRTITQQQVIDYIEKNTDTSHKLDLSKWGSEVDIASNLHTNNIQLVQGEERTFTVQPLDGFTINGTATFEVKYTPSFEVPFIDIDDTEYTTISIFNNGGDTNSGLIFTGLTNTDWPTSGTKQVGTNGIQVKFKTTISGTFQQTFIITGNGGTYYVSLKNPIFRSKSFIAGSTWLFKNGEDPLDVTPFNGIEITTNDYDTVEFKLTSNETPSIVLHGLKNIPNWPTGLSNSIPSDGVKITFKTGDSQHNNAGPNLYWIVDEKYNGFIFKSDIDGSHIFRIKAGETWIYKNNIDPVQVS